MSIKITITAIILTLGLVSAYAEESNLQKGFQAAAEGNYTDAMRFFKDGAMEGDKYCYGRVAALYAMGIGVDVNLPEARKWAMKGHELGNSYSAAMVGYSYILEHGADNLNVLKMALPYLEYAYLAEDREFDNAELYANMGLTIATTKMQTDDWQEGLVWLDQVVEDFSSYSPLLGQVAYMYWSLDEYPKAVRYATTADKEDNPQGSFVLGWCMAHGEGTELNEEAGFKKIRKAANIGIPEYAMYALGECYYCGIGTPVDKSLAKEWYEKAAAAGVEEAQEELETLF